METIITNFNGMLWVWIAIAVVTFITLFFIKAPFGRHVRKDFGPLMSNKWGWVIMEFPSIALICLFYFLGNGQKDAYTTFFVTLWVFHYFNRTFIFPFRLRDTNKKIPVAIVLSAIFFNLMNGSTNGIYFGYLADYPAQYYLNPHFIVGIGLFIIGWTINFWADHRLIHLRKPGETAYVLPKGGLFEYLASPNLFGEIIEWIGFAIAVNSLATWGFAIWTCANLIPRCRDHYRWSVAKFENYPSQRKILIPFIW